MFSYFGSKSKIINYYQSPKYKTIVEPFAGSAKYSLKYWNNDVILIEKNIDIYNIWKYLQSCSKKDILSLPNTEPGGAAVDTGFKPSNDLIFLNSCRGNASIYKCKKYGKFNSWNKVKIKISDELEHIKHWMIYNENYDKIPSNFEATWFIDPPYQKLGYRYASKFNDYESLKNWIYTLNGQVIVCENSDSNWFPNMKPLKQMQGLKHSKTELVWYNH